MMIVRNDIPHKRRPEFENDISHVQSLVVELLVRSQKWFYIVFYKSPKVKDSDFIECLVKTYDSVLAEAKEVILVGDFNIDMMTDNVITDNICSMYDAVNLIIGPTCFKAGAGTLLDPVIVTNRSRYYTAFNVACGFSDFHNMVGVSRNLLCHRLS